MAREIIHLPTDEARKVYSQLSLASRELISRCILSDDPRSFVFLIEEMEIVLRIVGQPIAAEYLKIACQHLAQHFVRFGTF